MRICARSLDSAKALDQKCSTNETMRARTKESDGQERGREREEMQGKVGSVCNGVINGPFSLGPTSTHY